MIAEPTAFDKWYTAADCTASRYMTAKTAWLAALEHAEGIVRSRSLSQSCCDEEAALCADAIKRVRES